ncbi:MAG: hypothetical protein WD872_03395 [Pirellulaceae bacterium]
MPRFLVTCDRVFDVLTRGPFPTGDASDDAVENHLRACHECRQLAEALQPAVELLHEALAPEQAADLPAYQGLLTVLQRDVITADRDTAETDRPTPLSLRVAPRGTSRRHRQHDLAWNGAVRLVAASLLVAALGTMLWSVAGVVQQRGSGSPLLAGVLSSPPAAKTSARLDDRGLMTLASLDLPANCFPGNALRPTAPRGRFPAGMSALNELWIRCCTECHHSAQSQRPSLHVVAAMQRSCVACHSL